ncbi:MAG: tRNA-dihydrouridine synthase [candidate division Zixibacteria bacterium]|nr:tRNA-dihydrouridine synthase [candidate division Zixibacteria bacterium]
MKALDPSAGFWARLKQPFYALAPMEDVTDAAFRLVVARRGKPDVVFAEFASADGLSSDRGLPNLMRLLYFDEIERPVVAQIFGEKPENMQVAARICRELGFDGVDINMGCPVKKVVRTGCGSALIETPALAKEIIQAVKEGAHPLPVSVKTRIGYREIVLEEWLGHLLDAKPAAITLHLRTRKEMSKVPAHWEVMPAAVAMAQNTQTLLIGNGDIRDLDHADRLIAENGMDGAMLGRAIYGNAWLFNRAVKPHDISVHDRLDLLVEHSVTYENIFAGRKNFVIMRKHLLAHTTGFFGCRELRQRLESVTTAADVLDAVAWFREAFDQVHDFSRHNISAAAAFGSRAGD